MRRDKPLIIAIIAMVVCLNTRYLTYVLYPFMIFSTWVHESCHGIAAILTGGGVKELYVYKDGSGLAYTYTSGENWKRAFVARYEGGALCIHQIRSGSNISPLVAVEVMLALHSLEACCFCFEGQDEDRPLD